MGTKGTLGEDKPKEGLDKLEIIMKTQAFKGKKRGQKM